MSKTINAKDQVLQLLTDIQKLKDQYPFLKMDIDVTARERVVMNEEEEYSTCEKCGKADENNQIYVKDGRDLCFNCKYGSPRLQSPWRPRCRGK